MFYSSPGFVRIWWNVRSSGFGLNCGIWTVCFILLFVKNWRTLFFSADWYGKGSLYLIWASQRCVSLSFFCCCGFFFLLTLNWWTVGFISLDFVQSGLVAVQFTQLCIKGMLKPSLFVSMACFESSILNSNSSHILLWIPITYSPFSRKLLSVTIQFITSALQINCTVCIQKEWGCCSVKGFLLPDECEILQEHTCNNEISTQCMVFAYKYCFLWEKSKYFQFERDCTRVYFWPQL